MVTFVARDKASSARKGLERRGARSTSRFRGVTHHCRTGRWEAHIWEDGKQVNAPRKSSQSQVARKRAHFLVTTNSHKKFLFATQIADFVIYGLQLDVVVSWNSRISHWGSISVL